MGVRDLIVGNILDLEYARLRKASVAHHHVGAGSGAQGAEADDLPTQVDRTKADRARDLIICDVVDLELASVNVAQDQIGRARSVDRSYSRELPIQADGADESRAGDLVVIDVIEYLA